MRISLGDTIHDQPAGTCTRVGVVSAGWLKEVGIVEIEVIDGLGHVGVVLDIVEGEVTRLVGVGVGCRMVGGGV